MKFKKVEKTTVKVDILKVLYISIFSGLRIRYNLFLGRLGIGKNSKNFFELYEAKKKLMHTGELSEELVNDWKSSNVKRVTPVVDRKLRLTNITDDIIKNNKNLTVKNSKHQRVAGFLDELFGNKESGISTVVHIGARIDTLSNYFSQKYKDIIFHSIDLQPNLAELNSVLGKRENWRLHNDYALKVFKNKQIKPDMIIMISTSPKFNNKEFHEYVEAFKNLNVKYLLFFEPWWAFPLSFYSLALKRPEELRTDISPIGGMTADFHHNYIYVLEKNNFSAVVSEIRNVEGETNYHEIYIFAVDNKLIDDGS